LTMFFMGDLTFKLLGQPYRAVSGMQSEI
jgi:hypothetical protein